MTDSKSIQDMGNIMNALNAATGEAPLSEDNPLGKKGGKDDVLANILEGFRNATDETVTTGNNDLKTALMTESTTDGVAIGAWRISVKPGAGKSKSYDVIRNDDSDERIASDLRLYEAALALVKALNEGEAVNSKRIKTILGIEEKYERALSEAVSYAARMKITEGAKYDVAEARYSESRHRALQAKQEIKKLSY